MASGALQAISKVSERRVASRSAWKNELLFCNKRDIGEQDLKVEFARKVLKKSGQLWDVKLLPKEVSKGTGTGVVMMVAEAIVVVVGVVVVCASDANDTVDVEDGDDGSVAEPVDLATSLLDVELLSTCRL